MIIIGAGVAGLMAALEIAPSPVTVLSTGEAASRLAQGGLAAAVGADDSVALHSADTVAAGAGLSEPEAVARIVGAAPVLMSSCLGVLRDEAGLRTALGRFSALSGNPAARLAVCIARAALDRAGSVDAHARTDSPIQARGVP